MLYVSIQPVSKIEHRDIRYIAVLPAAAFDGENCNYSLFIDDRIPPTR